MAKQAYVALMALFLWPSSGWAQTAATRPWDTAFTIGLFNGQPAQGALVQYGEDWFHTADYRASVGKLWGEHFKTELELGTTGEGSRYVTRFGGNALPISAREFYRVHQLTARATWQFLDNTWVQPYLSAGVIGEAEQKRTQIFERTIHDEGPAHTTYRPGVSLGAGAKFYMTPRSFFKAGVQSTWTTGASISFHAGFGIDL